MVASHKNFASIRPMPRKNFFKQNEAQFRCRKCYCLKFKVGLCRFSHTGRNSAAPVLSTMHTGLLSNKMNGQQLFELIITQCAWWITLAHWVIINSNSLCSFILYDNNPVCMVDNTGAAEKS